MFAKGCKADIVDIRDVKLGRFINHREEIPLSLDYRSFAPECKDQLNLPACVTHACTTIKETADRRSEEYCALSQLWLYDQCKHRDGDPYGEGTSIRVAMRIMAKKGVIPYHLLPYDGVYFYGRFEEQQFEEVLARPYRIKQYARLDNIDDMCRCLVQHGPFAMGVQVTDEFERVGIDNYIPLHFKSIEEGHGIAVMGYDLMERTFLIFNSWGLQWGNAGWARLPFEYWERFGMDAWGMVDISPNEA